MKLPDLRSGPVQQITAPDPNVAAAQGEAVAKAFGALGDLAEGIYKREAETQYLKGDREAREKLQGAHLSVSEAMLDVDSPTLEGIDYNPEDISKGADGKEYIPTYKVQEQILTRAQEQAYSEATIGMNPLALQAFDRDWEKVSATSASTGLKQAAKNMKAYSLGESMKSYYGALQKGDYAGAKQALTAAQSFGMAPEKLAKANYDLDIAEAGVGIRAVEESGDPDAMQDMADELRDPDYSGPIPYIDRMNKADALEQEAYRTEQAEITAEVKIEEDRLNTLLIGDPETPSDVRELEAEAKYLQSEDYQGPITDPKKRESLAAQMLDKAATSTLSESAILERQTAVEVSNAQLGINNPNGKTTTIKVEDMFNRGLISGARRTSMLEGILKRDEQKQTDAAMSNYLQAAMANGTPLDPGNKDIRKAVNNDFDAKMQGGDTFLGASFSSMRDYGIMPDKTKGYIRAANRGDSPDLIDAAKVYNTGLTVAPQSMLDLGKGDADVVRAVAANIRLGMPDEDAVASVLAWNAMPEAQKKNRTEVLKATQKANGAMLQDMVADDDRFDRPWNPFTPNVNSGMTIQFDMLVNRYAATHGSIQQAQQMAYQDIRTQWSLTDINGDWQYMQFAPQVEAQTLRADLDNTYGKGVVIRSDPATQMQIQNGELPTYSVYKAEYEADSLPQEGWAEQFTKEAGVEPAAMNINSRDEADKYLQDMATVGFLELPRYTFDSEKATKRETDRLKAEANAAVESKRDFNRAKSKLKQDTFEASIKRKASRGVPYAERADFFSSAKGQAAVERGIKNAAAADEISQERADLARENFAGGIGF